jgi:multidrug resistance protein
MKTKALILFTIFIDVLGIGIIIPVLPFYVRSFGVSDAVVTLLFAVYALFAFFSAPFLGMLSDKIGRRPVLIGSIVSTAVGWLVFAKAKTIIWLFAGRIIDGFAAGNITTAQTLLADIATDDKERSVNMGLFGALFGIGFIIGPALGGLLAHFGNTVPFWFVGILAAINAVLAYFFLPETHTKPSEHPRISLNPFKPIWDGLKNAEARMLFIAWLLFGIAIATQQGTFALYVNRIFGISLVRKPLSVVRWIIERMPNGEYIHGCLKVRKNFFIHDFFMHFFYNMSNGEIMLASLWKVHDADNQAYYEEDSYKWSHPLDYANAIIQINARIKRILDEGLES